MNTEERIKHLENENKLQKELIKTLTSRLDTLESRITNIARNGGFI